MLHSSTGISLGMQREEHMEEVRGDIQVNRGTPPHPASFSSRFLESLEYCMECKEADNVGRQKSQETIEANVGLQEDDKGDEAGHGSEEEREVWITGTIPTRPIVTQPGDYKATNDRQTKGLEMGKRRRHR